MTAARSVPPAPVVAIPTDDDALRAALGVAEVPALLPAIAYATGDLTVLRPELRPDPARMLEPDAGVSEAAKAEARALAFDALVRLRHAGSVLAPPPTPDALRQMLEFSVGGPGGADMEAYLPLFREELGVDGEDLRAPTWNKADLAPDTPFVVAIVGAGMSGLLAAHRLHQAGVDYVVIEKNDDVGGTWLENTYPGCRVDVPNAFYSYSFAQRDTWPQHFSSQDVLLDYFRRCADEFGVRDHIRFRTEVCSATFDDDSCLWTLTLRAPDGGEEQLRVNAVVSAVGQLNRPNMPDIAGMEKFAGPAFHSARWDHHVDVSGKRVAVIGTGASAAQFVPVIAEQVSELVVFQRTPPWFAPTPDYHEPVSDALRYLFDNVPFYEHWYRFWLFWRNADGMLQLVHVDPAWEPRDQSVSIENEGLRLLLAAYLEAEFADRPDLLEKVMPSYPPAAKRMLRDNGVWARALKRDNVQLITEKISEITETCVRTADGVDHDVDVIVYGTGFEASRFLTPMKVLGRGGVDLHQEWHGDARAYLGVVVPHFPNLFLLYGPNTNIVINGSIIFFSECEVQYLMGCLQLLLSTHHRALDCRHDVHDAYNERIDAGNRQRAWGASTVNSWYKNERGRVTQNWPFSLLEYWRQTRAPNASDFELL